MLRVANENAAYGESEPDGHRLHKVCFARLFLWSQIFFLTEKFRDPAYGESEPDGH
jgi:hypothetical protein